MNNVPSHNARPFFDVARDIRRGAFIDEMADAIQQVVASVEETGKAGKVIVEIAVAPASKGQGAVKVADKITLKLPALPAGETIMFVTPDNNLVANDPRQSTLELKTVSQRPQELKTANA
ncbi:MAG: hypothetical protein CTY14_02230 [Methylotenera sp.]|nr:MAG: hypothetical protein CTY14_02230 [Methylotenera sp.]